MAAKKGNKPTSCFEEMQGTHRGGFITSYVTSETGWLYSLFSREFKELIGQNIEFAFEGK